MDELFPLVVAALTESAATRDDDRVARSGAQGTPVSHPPLYQEAVEFYDRRGWTDGHPIVLPTLERVTEWLPVLGVEPDTIVGTSPERNRAITMKQVVINSIMAVVVLEVLRLVVGCVESISAFSPLLFHHNHMASLGGPWPFFLAERADRRRVAPQLRPVRAGARFSSERDGGPRGEPGDVELCGTASRRRPAWRRRTIVAK